MFFLAMFMRQIYRQKESDIYLISGDEPIGGGIKGNRAVMITLDGRKFGAYGSRWIAFEYLMRRIGESIPNSEMVSQLGVNGFPILNNSVYFALEANSSAKGICRLYRRKAIPTSEELEKILEGDRKFGVIVVEDILTVA
jgi:hypothetical protein